AKKAPSKGTKSGTSKHRVSTIVQTNPVATTSAGRAGAGMEVYGLLLSAFSVLLLLSLVSFDPRDIAMDYQLRNGQVHNLIGPVGAHIADLILRILGVGGLLVCSTFFYFGGVLLAGRRPTISGGGLGAYILVIGFGCVLAHMGFAGLRPFAHSPGGLTGEWVGEILRTLFATTGAVIIALSILAAAALRLSGLTVRQVARLPARVYWAAKHRAAKRDPNAPNWLERLTGLRKPREADRPGWLNDDQAANDPPVTRPARPHAGLETPAAPPHSAEASRPVAEDRISVPQRPEILTPTAGPAPPSTPEPVRQDPGPRAPRTERTPPPRHVEQEAPARPTPVTRPPAVRLPVDRAPVAAEPPKPEAPQRPPLRNAPPELVEPAPTSLPADAGSSPQPIEKFRPTEVTPITPVTSGTPAVAGPIDIVERPAAQPLPLLGDQERLPFDGVGPYEFPSISMLDYEAPQRGNVDRDALNAAASTLEAKLADFGVKGKVVKIMPGPVVTMFEFLPAAGVKISKIANLSDDLTMALHAQRVRIVAPIPGKGVVGIEVPSAVRETVYLKEILASSVFQDGKAKIPIALGKDIGGKPVVADLAKAPHLLVAGSTGSGKSVAINAFIMSLVYNQRPADLRLILVDPKMLELSVYDDIPHLLLPVVTEAKKASLALKWAVAEMERRYRLLAQCGVRNSAGFNQKLVHYLDGSKPTPKGIADDELEHLPYIVIILDELADLMMVSGKEVEQSIARLAQMARASGIHLVVATQRPSVDVVTGLIKANFPTRMSFMVSQKVDSRTILDRSGAENLLGQGDMLFLPPGTSKLNRIQGCFVSDDEVERVVEHLKKFGPPDYDMDILLDDDEQAKDLSKEDYDVHFDEAVAIVCDTRNPSISYLQRRLKIGYNRSARIIERMEHDGIISRPDHRGARKVLAPDLPPQE
ncbi:MAG: DNA segregation ATPase FtsK/SpoIIIE-like protein, partial [Myxococcota bacterium]